MLSKEVCKKCSAVNRPYGADKWEALDEDNWKEGIVYCPKPIQKWIYHKDAIKTCLRKFEQSVAAGINHAQ